MEETIKRKTLAPGLEWISASGKLGDAPIQSEILSVDLSRYQLKPLTGAHLLSKAAYFPRSTVSGLLLESGAHAAVNASFFDIKGTQSPAGLVIIDRYLIRNPEARSPVLFLKPGQAVITQPVTWEASFRLGESKYPLSGVNSPTIKRNEIALYAAPWKRTLGAGFHKEGPILEIIVKESDWVPASARDQKSRLKGRVIGVRENAPSRALKDG